MDEDRERTPRPRRRAPRSDAKANQERVLAAAVAMIRRCGTQVPFSTIAAEAGVGTATLYRSYPDRHSLLSALARSPSASASASCIRGCWNAASGREPFVGTSPAH